MSNIWDIQTNTWLLQNNIEKYKINIDKIIDNVYIDIIQKIEFYLPKIIWALVVLIIWWIIAYWSYRFVMYLFKKFNIIELIEKLNIDLIDDDEEISNYSKAKAENNKKKIIKKFTDKIKIDDITWKAVAYYLFLIFFRLSIVIIWIKEVEDFLWEIIAYLPSLFIWVVIWFFWIRFANFVYDVVFHTLNLSKQKTAKIIASGAKIIILFFTLMWVLSKIWIASDIITATFIWFITMLTLAWWLAFWLWWKDIAKEIFESFRK